jgi:threonine synthase
MNSVLSLSDEEAPHGVVTHSSGNHAGALACAAKLRGIQAHIVIPSDAPQACSCLSMLSCWSCALLCVLCPLHT